MLKDAGGEETRDNVRDSIASMPDGHPGWILVFVVPGGRHWANQHERNISLRSVSWALTQRDTREERRFSKTDDKSAHSEANTTMTLLALPIDSAFSDSDLLCH